MTTHCKIIVVRASEMHTGYLKMIQKNEEMLYML